MQNERATGRKLFDNNNNNNAFWMGTACGRHFHINLSIPYMRRLNCIIRIMARRHGVHFIPGVTKLFLADIY